MWHRRWIGLAAAWFAAIVGVAVVYRIPEKYEASARVYVDTESLLSPLLAGLAIQPNLDQQVALISRTLISRPNVEKLVRMADLDLSVKPATARDEVIDNVIKSIQLAGGSVDQSVRHRLPRPDSGARQKGRAVVAHDLRRIESRRQAAGYAHRGQVPRRADQALRGDPASRRGPPQGFQAQVHGHCPAGDRTTSAGLRACAQQIESAKLGAAMPPRSHAIPTSGIRRRDTDVSAGAGDPDAQDAVPEIDDRIAGLKKELDDLLRKYTDQHPDVLADQAADRAARGADGRRSWRRGTRPTPRRSDRSGPSADRNPVFQQLRLSLADAEANVASARAKLAGYTESVPTAEGASAAGPAESKRSSRNSIATTTSRKRPTRACSPGASRAQWASTYRTPAARSSASSILRGFRRNRWRRTDPVLLGIALWRHRSWRDWLVSFLASQVMPIFHDARALREGERAGRSSGMVSMLPSPGLSAPQAPQRYLFAGWRRRVGWLRLPASLPSP